MTDRAADSDLLYIPGELLFSFEVWDLDDACPHCGSMDVELDGDDYNLWYICEDCKCFSAYSVDDREIEETINRLTREWLDLDDRFDILDMFDRDYPGMGG